MAASDTIVFRADCSPAIGMGHVSRCSAIAQYLALSGRQCYLATSMREFVSSELAGAFTGIIALDGGREHEIDSIRNAIQCPINMMVVDHYDRGIEFESSSRAYAEKICVIDDYGKRKHDCDILFDPNPDSAFETYRPLLPVDAAFYSGTDYALLRSDFGKARYGPVEYKKHPECAVAILPGGMDVSNVSVPVLTGLANRSVYSVAVLSSKAFISPAVSELVSSRPDDMAARYDLSGREISEFMQATEVAISTASTVIWELCAMGVVPIYFAIDEKQLHIAKSLSSRGVGTFVDQTGSTLIEALVSEACNSLRAKDATQSLAAAVLIDGLGAGRASLRLFPEFDKEGREVVLRRVCSADSSRILEWQLEEGAREFSRNPDVPSSEEHAAWFQKRLADPQCVFQIIEVAGEAAGMCRLDPSTKGPNGNGMEISILVSRDFQGCGVGAAALRTMRRLVPFVDLMAYIKFENKASLMMFQNCDYVHFADCYFVNYATDSTATGSV